MGEKLCIQYPCMLLTTVHCASFYLTRYDSYVYTVSLRRQTFKFSEEPLTCDMLFGNKKIRALNLSPKYSGNFRLSTCIRQAKICFVVHL
jgi:hypothetical protein